MRKSREIISITVGIRLKHLQQIDATGQGFKHQTNSPVQVQLFIPKLGKATTDLLVSGVVIGNRVDSLKALFGKYFSNKLQVVSMEQQTPWGQPVEIAAKVDLTGMDSKNLVFYSYNKATNIYTEIKSPNYCRF